MIFGLFAATVRYALADMLKTLPFEFRSVFSVKFRDRKTPCRTLGGVSEQLALVV